MSNEQWSEWIEWNGGDMPLPGGYLVEVKRCDLKKRSGFASQFYWGLSGGSSAVSCYRYKIEESESKSMSKPNWKDAPEWAHWLAQDEDGEWFWYEDQPTDENCSWQDDGNGKVRSAGLSDENGTWAFTLEKRPIYSGSTMTAEEEEMPAEERTRTAPDFLRQAASLMQERGKQYDQPEGERSMGKTIAAFNVITGRDLTEAEGWLIQTILKRVRQFSQPAYHKDSAEDAVAYAALEAESLEASALRARELEK